MPNAVSLNFTEPYQYQERIRPAEVQIVPIARGEFRATLAQIDLPQLTIQHGWQSLPTVFRAGLHRSRSSVLFHTAPAQPIIRTGGIDLSADVLVQAAPGEEHVLQAAADCSWASML